MHERHQITGPSGLIAGIVHQSVIDLKSRNPTVRADAERFFTDGRLATWIDGTGLSADSITRRLSRQRATGNP